MISASNAMAGYIYFPTSGVLANNCISSAPEECRFRMPQPLGAKYVRQKEVLLQRQLPAIREGTSELACCRASFQAEAAPLLTAFFEHWG